MGRVAVDPAALRMHSPAPYPLPPSTPMPLQKRTPRAAALVAATVALAAAAAAACVPVMRPVMRADSSVLFRHATNRKVVALTLDDGPFAGTTEQLLDVLRRHGARATFFVIGSHAAQHPEAVRRMLREGHEVAHHMWVDTPSAELQPADFDEHFERTDSVLRALGAEPHLFRPGSGRFNPHKLQRLRDREYRGVLGDVYPFDAGPSTPGMSYDLIRASLRPGSIIILHDGPKRGPRTVQVLNRLLPELKQAGWEVVTVSELVPPAR